MPRKGSGTGVSMHEKGYLRRWRRGPNRGQLVHRMVMAELCRIWCYYPLNGNGLPHGFDVHHVDFSKTHNCPANLLLIEHTLHTAADQLRRNDLRWPLCNFEDVDD